MAIQSVSQTSTLQAPVKARTAPAVEAIDPKANQAKEAETKAVAKASAEAQAAKTVTNNLGQTLGQNVNMVA